MTDKPITLYYDGACPLCLKEIGLLKRLDGQRGRLGFEDVSSAEMTPSCPIDRADLLAKFHAKLPNGDVVVGAQAFTEAWATIPWMVWLRPIGRFGPTRWLLNRAYEGFLRVRPRLQRFVRARTASS